MIAKRLRWKVGDRVAVYNWTRKVGTIAEMCNESVYVRFSIDSGTWFHPKQLRRLKPKPPQAERATEFWIYEGSIAGIMYEYGPVQILWANSKKLKVTHVREVLPGSVVVTRESLKKIWPAQLEYWFENICEKLSVPEVKS